MENELYAFALENILQEIQNACPEVTSNFIFKDGKILAKNKNIEEETVTQIIENFEALAERADLIGDLESIIIQSSEGKTNIGATEDFYLTTVSSKEADEKYVNTLTRILIPIVIKLSEKIRPASPDNETITTEPEPEPEEDDAYKPQEESETTEMEQPEEETDMPEPKPDNAYEPPEENFYLNEESETTEMEQPEEETDMPEPEPDEEPEIDDEPLLPEPPVTQLIVENLGGLLVPSDTVRVDSEVITRWNELYGDNDIKQVEVEALNGKTTRCKFKQIKKSKDTGKGIVKMPEKIQLTLETQKGELVTVKPVIEKTK